MIGSRSANLGLEVGRNPGISSDGVDGKKTTPAKLEVESPRLDGRVGLAVAQVSAPKPGHAGRLNLETGARTWGTRLTWVWAVPYLVH